MNGSFEERVLVELGNLKTEMAKLRGEMNTAFANLPSDYVPRREVVAARNEAKVAKRYAIGTVIGVVAALIPIFVKVF